jgi:hypothetical protein
MGAIDQSPALTDEARTNLKKAKDIEPFNYSNFIDTYIDISTKKWCTDNKNTNDVINALTQTKKIIDDTYNENQREIDEVNEQLRAKLQEMTEGPVIPAAVATNDSKESNEELKYFLNQIVDMFDIGKYVILEKDQIDNAARADIIERLNNINKAFGSEEFNNVRGGRRKTQRKRYNKKGTRKYYKRGGGWKRNLIRVLCVAAFATVVVFTFGIAGVVAIGGLAYLIAPTLILTVAALGPSDAALGLSDKKESNQEKYKQEESNEEESN